MIAVFKLTRISFLISKLFFDNLWIFFSADCLGLFFNFVKKKDYCLNHRSWRRRGCWRPIWMERGFFYVDVRMFFLGSEGVFGGICSSTTTHPVPMWLIAMMRSSRREEWWREAGRKLFVFDAWKTCPLALKHFLPLPILLGVRVGL